MVTEAFGINTALASPLALNPAPVVEMPEMVTLAVPESVNTTDCVARVPTGTLPTPTAVALAVSWDDSWDGVGGPLLATPVPKRLILTAEFAASLEIFSVP